MKRKMTIRAISLLLAAMMLLGCVGMITAGAEEVTWKLSEDTEIFWVKTNDSDKDFEKLSEQVRLFAGALAAKGVTEEVLPITYGEKAKAGATDILLVLNDEGTNLENQAYKILVSGGTVTVNAEDAAGLMYGCNSLIRQLLINECVVSTEDAPDVAERALMLDIGRKYYTVDWIKKMIRELAWADMNALVLHFSEEMGLGIESELYPWLAGRDGTLCTQAEVATDNSYLTQEEIKDIVAYAKLYHVEIIPSFDSPGHMNYIVKKFNEQCAEKDYSFDYDGITYTAEAGSEIGNYYHYNGQTSIVKGSRNTAYSRGIDISNEVAVAFTKSLIEEYATLFKTLGCDKFDIGGDELLGWGSAIATNVNKWQQLDHWKNQAIQWTGNSNAVAYDAFLYYMNDLYDLVTGLGYTSVRMWNDDALRTSDTGWNRVVELNKNIEILFWTADANSKKNTVNTYLNAGHSVYNYWDTYNYYALGTTSYPGVDPETIYNEWSPYVFTSGESIDSNSAVKGSAYCIWADNPSVATEDEVMSYALPMIRANGAKAWDAGTDVPYATYVANKTKTGDAPEVPDEVTADVEIWVIPDLTDLELAIAEYEALDSRLYTEESYAACTAAANAAKLLLEGKPSQAEVDAAAAALNEVLGDLVLNVNIGELVAAIARYDLVNSEIYTEESFARYTAAVNAAKALLKGNPSQEEVDAAVDAIEAAFAALERAPVDTTELEAAIAEYYEMDSDKYTKKSFDLYTAAVKAGEKLLTVTPKQEEVNAALKLILRRKSELQEIETATEVVWYISGEFKSSTVCIPKAAIVQISVLKGLDITDFVIENGQNEIDIVSKKCNTSKTDRDNWTLKFYPTEAEIGQSMYTIYAIMEDGTRSDYGLTLKLQVK